MLRTLISEELRFLTFRPVGPALAENARAFLLFGLVFTWLAGVGRYWDNPRARWWQLLGLGSVVYVFVLALVIWGLLAPLRPRRWSYRNVLLFVTLTAPPALLYAIPVEKFLSMDAALTANAWFLGVVAAWRVALYAVFLWRVGGLSPGAIAVGTLLPLTIIVVALSALNLEHVVFELMGGLRSPHRSGNDTAYGIVILLSFASVWASPFLAIGYGFLAYQARRRARAERAAQGEP